MRLVVVVLDDDDERTYPEVYASRDIDASDPEGVIDAVADLERERRRLEDDDVVEGE